MVLLLVHPLGIVGVALARSAGIPTGIVNRCIAMRLIFKTAALTLGVLPILPALAAFCLLLLQVASTGPVNSIQLGLLIRNMLFFMGAICIFLSVFTAVRKVMLCHLAEV